MTMTAEAPATTEAPTVAVTTNPRAVADSLRTVGRSGQSIDGEYPLPTGGASSEDALSGLPWGLREPGASGLAPGVPTKHKAPPHPKVRGRALLCPGCRPRHRTVAVTRPEGRQLARTPAYNQPCHHANRPPVRTAAVVTVSDDDSIRILVMPARVEV
jgi:hypothetical protein